MSRNGVRRVFWLLNHTTLRDAEVPVLQSLGCEVYTPKKIQDTIECRTASVDYQHDQGLTIPKQDLATLNQFNFYDEKWRPEIHQLVRKHFDAVITAFIIPSVYNILRFYDGLILLRVFGLAGTLNYEAITDLAPDQIDRLENQHYPTSHGLSERLREMDYQWRGKKLFSHFNPLTRLLYRARHRVHLAAAYESIIENELPFFRSRSLYLPLGMGPEHYQAADTWTGEDRRVLFVCPNVNQVLYYRLIYQKFIDELGSLPYTIGGRQDLGGQDLADPIRDERIMGFQPQAEFEQMLRHHRVMFYHSIDPRHLHYHPLEAIVRGMPLIFMQGGMLELLGGRGLPGICETYAEAKMKLQRILDGDQAFTQAVIRSQAVMLDRFREDFVRSHWQKSFAPLLEKPRLAKAA